MNIKNTCDKCGNVYEDKVWKWMDKYNALLDKYGDVLANGNTSP